MAEKKLKEVEEQLNCSICLDTYTNPKLLQCFHVFCQPCLEKLVGQQGPLGLTCPTCRQVTPIPDRGVAGLPLAFHIADVLEIVKKAPTDHDVTYCAVHKGKVLELYCETCGELICVKCALKGGKHNSHNYADLHQAFEKYKVEIAPLLEANEKRVTAIENTLGQLTSRYEEISYQTVATEDCIRDTFRQLRKVLDVRETELIGKLDQIADCKTKELAVQKNHVEITLNQLTSCLDFMRKSLQTADKARVLMMKRSAVKQVSDLAGLFKPHILEPIAEADIVFSVSADMAAVCRKHWQVYTPSLPDPSQCYLTGRGVEMAAVGEMSTVTVHVKNYGGEHCEEPMEILECYIVSLLTGAQENCTLQRKGQSQYEISYQPTIKGRHQLHIKAEGQHIRGSPFYIAVKSPIKLAIGSPILTISKVKAPLGVAISQRGEVVVTECGQHCVSIYNASGVKLRSFGMYGSGQGKLMYPRGVAADGEGNIFVIDSGNHRVQKFTTGGNFSTQVGDGDLHFSDPTDIAFDSGNNKVYVVDTSNDRVQVLNSDLTFSGTFGEKGSGKGQFDKPRGIACDKTGKVYVADYNNHRIQVFTAEGKFLSMFGRRGRSVDYCHWPCGVAVDTSGTVYVSTGSNHVSVFTSKGELENSFGKKGKGPGEFQCPRGLAVDNSGVVYVCDTDNNRVQLF